MRKRQDGWKQQPYNIFRKMARGKFNKVRVKNTTSVHIDNLEDDEVEDFLATVVNQEFDTIIEDGSLQTVNNARSKFMIYVMAYTFT